MRHRVAHRGYSGVAPENTLPAFAAALRGGATIVEFDVRTTADGVPVVIHDRTLERTTTGTGPVWEAEFDGVRRLDAGAWFSPAYAGVRVPTLAETIDLIAAADVELLLEIKPPATPEQVKVILEQVASRGLLDRTIVQSFDPAVVAMVPSEWRRGLLRLRLDPDTLSLAISLGVAYCNPSIADFFRETDIISSLVAAGIEIMPWTANDPAQWPALAAAGAAGLITDRVAELTGWSFPG
ncbi:glycerophosphodiester phosphodiesterase family protein [Actinoplanes sp. NPDC051411]|uniref:glycerophosphodiester phosphodiesterase n=1 Tax=Actinoplanes sp. NPDC051411 TaxID=3155522 RepID=UPI00341D4170